MLVNYALSNEETIINYLESKNFFSFKSFVFFSPFFKTIYNDFQEKFFFINDNFKFFYFLH